jgi:hypothetical protein
MNPAESDLRGVYFYCPSLTNFSNSISLKNASYIAADGQRDLRRTSMLMSLFRAIFFICAGGGLAACVAPQGANAPRTEPGTPITLSTVQVKTVQAGVQNRLKDPESARFEPKVLAARKSNGDIAACRMVNAKNSYGGYVGMSPFIATLRDGKVIDSATASGRDAEFVLILCRQEGVPI